MTAFVKATARSSPARAHELHRLVHRRVRRDAVHEGELVGAEPERGAHRRVELAHRPPAERLDRVVERPDALHRPVGELLAKARSRASSPSAAPRKARSA